MCTYRYIGILLLCLLFSGVVAGQQLRLGKHVLALQKSAILELESDNQGLLLPRITDTALINAFSPPDGMVIFYQPLRKFMVRSNSRWTPLGGRLADQEDVTISSPSAGQLLRYDGSKWVNTTPTYLSSVDTSNIASFYLKVRGLMTAGTGITYNQNTGVISSQAPVYYSNGIGGSASVNTVTKIWVADVTNTATGTQTITIPANIGFTNILCITATAKGGTDVTNNPLVTISSSSTTSIGIRVVESKNTGVLIGGNVEGLEMHTSTSTHIYLRVEGN